MNSEKKSRGALWGALWGALIALGCLILLFAWLLVWLTLSEYKPEALEEVPLEGTVSEVLVPGQELTILTWNIGYGALGDNADFFMDGGKGVRTADEARVRMNMDGISSAIQFQSPDVIFLQECDLDSSRSHRMDEAAFLTSALPGYQSAFVYNYKVLYVPYPMPPIGRVNSGLLTLSRFQAASAERVALPCPFTWPVRLANLKRCLLVERLPIEGSDRQLVLVNLHLEVYDDGEGKRAQTELLRGFLEAEAEAGNYVVAGGDFNQIFSDIENPYPSQEGMWLPRELDTKEFPEDWQFLMDTTLPSCRSLDQPLAGADLESFQYYLIDGFIVSSDLTVENLSALDLGFVCSDHNPVLLTLRLPV